MSFSRGVQSTRRRVNGVALLSMLLWSAGCHRNGTSASTKTPPPAARIPRDASRFEVSSSTDSTVTFKTFEATWVRVGQRAHAVDPRQHDAVIARLTITSIDTAGAHAAITGKVAEVVTDHVVLLPQPKKSRWHDRRFWGGAAAGALIGAAIGVGASAGK